MQSGTGGKVLLVRRVLLVGPVSRTGGVSRFVSNLLNAGIGYEIIAFNTARPPKPRTSKGAVGYRSLLAAGVLWAGRNALITGWNIARFPIAVLLSRAVLVHIATSSHWTFWESSGYLVLSKLLGRRSILHFLGDFHKFCDSAPVVEMALIRQVLRGADRVIVLSESVRKMVLSIVGGQEVVVVPSTVPPDLLRPRLPERKEALEKMPFLFMGGNYGIRKGVRDLIAAIDRVLGECDHVHFLLCGGGDVEAAYQAIGDGLKGAVDYVGWVDDAGKSSLLSMASVYVLPSYSEGMPYGIVEAMASGLAIIATNVGSIPEFVIDGENGLLIAPGDVDGLARSILKLARNGDLTRKMAETNRVKASEELTPSRMQDAIQGAYDSVLSRSS